MHILKKGVIYTFKSPNLWWGWGAGGTMLSRVWKNVDNVLELSFSSGSDMYIVFAINEIINIRIYKQIQQTLSLPLVRLF